MVSSKPGGAENRQNFLKRTEKKSRKFANLSLNNYFQRYFIVKINKNLIYGFNVNF